MNRPGLESRERPPLLSTNMRVPQQHGELIIRVGLLERLDRALYVPLTLIAAPAGFGKTTALAQWITGTGRENPLDRVAWVSLEHEQDLRQFWSYIVTALQGIQPEIAEPALTLLDSPRSPLYTMPTILINEISSIVGDCVLVLDDYHLIDDPAIHTALDFFIDHLPPNLHVILASRSDPPLSLARWRASSQLIELREDDLRFTPVEIATFLNEIKGLNISDQDVAALETRTEGWIAGLQLVALSMQGYDDRSKHRFISEFTGSQRYIFDYLVREVLQRQPEKIRTFLLKTSVLNRLCAGLCNALTGRADGQTVLEHLERSNLFTIPLDQERRWYRFHHLFRDVLRHRLQHDQPDVELGLHRRAASWYIENEEPEAAIRHACAAQQWEQAIALITSRIDSLWNRGEIRRILNWLGKLPDQYLDAHPDLSLYYSRALLLGGQMEDAARRLREAEAVLRDRLREQSSENDRFLLGTVCAFRTTLAAVTGRPKSALALGREALTLLPQANIDIRAHATNSLGVTHCYLGQMVEASQMCAEAGDLARQAGNLYLVMAAAAYRAKALVSLGELTQAGKVLKEALSLSYSPDWAGQARIPAASVACASYGRLLYEWNRLEEAEAYSAEAIELGQHLAFGSALWVAYQTRVRVALAHGNKGSAMSMLERAQRYNRSQSVPLPARLVEAELAAAHMALGQVEEAGRWADKVGSSSSDSPGLIQEIELMTLARFYLIQGQPERALSLLTRLHPLAASQGRRGQIIGILILFALAHHAQGELQLATATLREALVLAQPEGYKRTFVDAGQAMAALLYQALASDVLPAYVNELLALFPDDALVSEPVSGPPSETGALESNERLIEPLTPREIEVLQLVADGASNSDIAGALTIAVSTAKKHVSNIINKLGVDNRTEAAAQGRQFGLCE